MPAIPAPAARLPVQPILPQTARPAAPRPANPAPAAPGDLALGWPGAGEGLNLLRGSTGQKRICMTFDGGSTAEVAAEVLDLLKARGIRTTLFLTGAFIQKYPELVRRMDREGHELGNHTLNHPHFAPGMRRDPRWTRERVQEELLEADRALYKLLGRPMDSLWRAPYGEHTAEIRKWAEELGYRHVGWSEGADTLDWATVKERRLYRTGNAILDKLHTRMEKQDGDGLIVLMHLGSGRPEADRPAKVLGPFLDKALSEGWHFVAIGEYLKGMGRPRWDASRRIALLGRPGGHSGSI
jgi:peptidoglycan/xylan/chitin deacetylase (PgdA/CDA1 family)